MPTAPGHDFKSFYFAVVDSDGSTTRDLSQYITGMSGLPGENELQDTSKVTDSGHTFTRTLWNAPFTIDGIYNKTSSAGPGDVLANLLGMTTATTFAAGPTGNTSGSADPNQQYSGSVWLRGLDTPGRVGSVVSFQARFQSNGVVTIGTFT